SPFSGSGFISLPSLKSLLRGRGDGIEALADLIAVGACELVDHRSVAQEHQVRPELHAERPAQRLAPALLDLNVPHGGVLLKQRRQLGLERLAVRTPARPELEDDGTAQRIDLLTCRLPTTEVRVICHALSLFFGATAETAVAHASTAVSA